MSYYSISDTKEAIVTNLNDIQKSIQNNININKLGKWAFHIQAIIKQA